MRILKNPLESDLTFTSANGYPVFFPAATFIRVVVSPTGKTREVKPGEVTVSDEQAKTILRLWNFIIDGGEIISKVELIVEDKPVKKLGKKVFKKVKKLKKKK